MMCNTFKRNIFLVKVFLLVILRLSQYLHCLDAVLLLFPSETYKSKIIKLTLISFLTRISLLSTRDQNKFCFFSISISLQIFVRCFLEKNILLSAFNVSQGGTTTEIRAIKQKIWQVKSREKPVKLSKIYLNNTSRFFVAILLTKKTLIF